MSLSLVQYGANEEGWTPSPLVCAYTFATPPAAGSVVLASVELNAVAAPTPTIEDTAGNLYHLAQHIVTTDPAPAAARQRWLYYAFNIATATPFTVTSTFASLPSGYVYHGLRCSEWAGWTGWRDPLIDADSASAMTLAGPYDFAIGSVTPVAAGDLIYASVGFAIGVGIDTTPSGLTVFNNGGAGVGNEYPYWGLAGGAGAYAADLSFSADTEVAGIAAAFRADNDDWLDVPEFQIHPIDAAQFPGGLARVVCSLWTKEAGQPTKARLVSLLADGVTIDAVVGTSAAVTSTTPTDASFAVTLTGNKLHKLQHTTPSDDDFFCAPGAEVRP